MCCIVSGARAGARCPLHDGVCVSRRCGHPVLAALLLHGQRVRQRLQAVHDAAGSGLPRDPRLDRGRRRGRDELQPGRPAVCLRPRGLPVLGVLDRAGCVDRMVLLRHRRGLPGLAAARGNRVLAVWPSVQLRREPMCSARLRVLSVQVRRLGRLAAVALPVEGMNLQRGAHGRHHGSRRLAALFCYRAPRQIVARGRDGGLSFPPRVLDARPRLHATAPYRRSSTATSCSPSRAPSCST